MTRLANWWQRRAAAQLAREEAATKAWAAERENYSDADVVNDLITYAAARIVYAPYEVAMRHGRLYVCVTA